MRDFKNLFKIALYKEFSNSLCSYPVNLQILQRAEISIDKNKKRILTHYSAQYLLFCNLSLLRHDFKRLQLCLLDFISVNEKQLGEIVFILNTDNLGLECTVFFSTLQTVENLKLIQSTILSNDPTTPRSVLSFPSLILYENLKRTVRVGIKTPFLLSKTAISINDNRFPRFSGIPIILYGIQ